jgi:hypothetical protein
MLAYIGLWEINSHPFVCILKKAISSIRGGEEAGERRGISKVIIMMHGGGSSYWPFVVCSNRSVYQGLEKGTQCDRWNVSSRTANFLILEF